MNAIDALRFVGPSRYDGRAAPTVEQVLDESEATGNRFVVVASTPPDRALARANDSVIERLERSAGRVRALARVDPLDPDAAHYARAALSAGCVGLYLDPWSDSYSIVNNARVEWMMDIAAIADVPIVVESGYPWVSEPAQVAACARAHPDVTFVATRGLQMNMSGLALQTATTALQDNPRLHLLTSGVYRQDWIEELCGLGLSSRLLFASMSPAFDAVLEWERVAQVTSDEARRTIAEGNAERVFGMQSE